MSDEELTTAVTNKNVMADQEMAHLCMSFDECNKKR